MVKTDCNRSKCIYSECNKKKVLKKKKVSRFTHLRVIKTIKLDSKSLVYCFEAK